MALDLLRPRQFGVGRGHNRERPARGLVIEWSHNRSERFEADHDRLRLAGSYGTKDGEEGEEGCGSCFIVGGLIT